jgi:acetyltransferase
MSGDLKQLFCPKSIAVIGASRDPGKVGAIALKNIIVSGFKGKIYPINPNIEEFGGLKFYPNVAGVPEVVDLAVVAVPAGAVLAVMEEIGQKGIKNAVVFSAGFKEAGEEGAKLEKLLVDVANKYQINMLGPNCFGFANNSLPVNVTFAQVIKNKGNLRIISQSGALAAAMFDWCLATGMGFDQLVTIGNKAVVNENSILRYWLQNPIGVLEDNAGLSAISPVGLYLESIAGGRELLSLISDISKENPVFILKPGKSAGAARAMKSHTGSIAGEDSVLEEALKEAGAIRCQELGDFFDLARAFSWENVPTGSRVAVISNAGGPAVLCADTIKSAGLELAEFSPETQQKLKDCLPRMAGLLNPVDVIGDALADRYGEALDIVLSEKTVNAAVVILTPQLMTQIDKTAEIIGSISKKYQQPVLCSFIGGSLTTVGEKILDGLRIPSFPFPERAIKALAAMWQWQKRKAISSTAAETAGEINLDLEPVKKIITKAKENKQAILNNLEADMLMEALEIPTPATGIAANLESASQFAQNCGWPVVLKLSSPGLLHKADVGGVITQIYNEEQLQKGITKLTHKIEEMDPDGKKAMQIQIQKEIDGGVEVILGVKRDPTFGPVMLFGAGGSLAELISDRNIHLLPITKESAKSLVAGSRIFPMLNGFRGNLPYDLEPIYEVMQKLAKLVETVSEIEEIEINPLKITLNGGWAIDPKVVLAESKVKTMPMEKFKMAITVEHKILTDKFHEIVFETTEPFVYLPGQYVSVKVSEERINAYSIAERVAENRFKVLIDISPGGPGSKYFENLKVGDKMAYLGPFGIFNLKPNDGAEQVLFMGTGSGCSPLKCMIEAVLNEYHWEKPIMMYFGLRYEKDIFWQDYFLNLAKTHPNFHYKLFLSQPEAGWQGETGHLTEAIKRDFPDASKFSVYLCGNKPMTEEAKKLLLECGCPKERIYEEQF